MALHQFRRRHLDRVGKFAMHVGQVGELDEVRVPAAGLGKNRNIGTVSGSARTAGDTPTIRLRMSVFVRLALRRLAVDRDDCHLLARREPGRRISDPHRLGVESLPVEVETQLSPTADSRLGKVSDGNTVAEGGAGQPMQHCIAPCEQPRG